MGEVWPYLATAFGSIIATGITFWLAYGRKLITREEVLELINEGGPYLKDKSYISSTLTRLEESYKYAINIANDLTKVMGELRIELVKLSSTLEHIQKHVKID